MQKKTVIDVPVRLFHWSLVALVAAAWASAEWGQLDWHVKIGQTILALLLWRVMWGLWGSPQARFAHFLASPMRVIKYLGTIFRRGSDMPVGYNAFGGWAIMAILGVLLAQATTGLFATDDILTDGPLAHLLSRPQQQQAAGLHEAIFNYGVLTLVALHLVANLWYGLYKRQPLLRRMIDGRQATNETPPPPAPLLRAILTLALACALIWCATNYLTILALL